MEHSLKGKNKHRLFSLVLIVTLLFSSFANIWQTKVSAAEPLDKIKIEVTKTWYETMPTGDNLIDNKGKVQETNLGTPEQGAQFRLYRLGNKNDATVANHFTDEMYSDLVGLIEEYRFDAIKSGSYTIEANDYPNIKEKLKAALGNSDTKTIENTGSVTASEEFNTIINLLLQNYITADAVTRVSSTGTDSAGTGTHNTDAAGKINFSNISNNSRYVLLEIATTKTGKRQVATPMLLDLPIMVESTGEPLNITGNDTLHVYPKNEYPVGGSQFYKYDGTSLKQTTKTPIAGAKFLLYKMPAGATEKAWSELPNNQLDVTASRNTAANWPSFESGVTYKVSGVSDVTRVLATESNSTQAVPPTNGEFSSQADGKIAVANLPKGRYFWIEAEPADGGYSLNRYPICFEINNTNANGAGTHAALPNYGNGFETFTVPNSSPEVTKVFTNYVKPTFDKTLKVLGDANATLGSVTNDTLNMDNRGIQKFQYTLKATLPDPNLVFGDSQYLSFYDIFATKKLNTWDLTTNEGDLLNVNTDGVFKKTDFPTTGDHKKGLYYDSGQEMLPLTRITETTLNPRLVIKNQKGETMGYYSAAADTANDPLYKGKFLDGYADDQSQSGIAHLGWFDIRKDAPSSNGWEGVLPQNQPFEQGTPAGTQLLCTVNVPELETHLGGKEAVKDVYSIEFEFTATPEDGLFNKGIEIDNVGQFEWAGGTSEDTIIEREVNFKTGGQNFIKLDGSSKASEAGIDADHPYNELAGAEFQLRRHTWTGTAWKVDYLQAGNSAKEPYTVPTSTSNTVLNWTTDVKTDTGAATYYKDKKIANSGNNHPTVFKSDANGVIAVRGLAPAGLNTDPERNHDMYYDLVEIKTPNAETASAQQYRLKKEPINFAVVAQDLYKTNNAIKLGVSSAVDKNYAIVMGNVKGTNNSLIDVRNLRATPFPITGGIGSLFLILLGLLGVGYWYMRKRRMTLAEQEAE
ncbi:hypothetical protein EQG49_07755 [Periweissella cryptocerci]|uniref:Uncharacterized protein n=1 Tax=Periweissella cryptocerci TaxID=2506420 RepID=A0A4P6YUH7_9LACO|nr:SpaA isopeptide-forming pilin-related protein [Periweissella cryptocerci]QBO36363.1 hypothetical protein EQG49_07755 [Periweissella cryptocerci]